MTGSIRNSELLIFEGCSHMPIYEKVDEFNQKEGVRTVCALDAQLITARRKIEWTKVIGPVG